MGSEALPKGEHQGLRGQLLHLPGDASLETCVFFQASSLLSAFFPGVRKKGVAWPVTRATSVSPSRPLCLSHTHTHWLQRQLLEGAGVPLTGAQGFGFLEEPPVKGEATTVSSSQQTVIQLQLPVPCFSSNTFFFFLEKFNWKILFPS